MPLKQMRWTAQQHGKGWSLEDDDDDDDEAGGGGQVRVGGRAQWVCVSDDAHTWRMGPHSRLLRLPGVLPSVP